MNDPSQIHRKVREHYEAVWQNGDAWDFESSAYEQDRYAHLLTLLDGRRYERALEIGCGSGRFTRLLASIADRVVALDVAPAAVERARRQTEAAAGPGVVDLRAVNVMEYNVAEEGPWDLVVFSETIYCLGWLYPFFNVAWLAHQLFAAAAPRGRLLLTNTYGRRERDWLQCPWLLHTYRDLVRNVGFCIEREEIFRGTKDGVDFEVLTTLFVKNDRGGGRGDRC